MNLSKQLLLITAITTTGSITLSAMEPQDPDTRTSEFARSQEASAERLSSFQEKMAELNNKYPGYSSKLERLLKSGLAATVWTYAGTTMIEPMKYIMVSCFSACAETSIICAKTFINILPPLAVLEIAFLCCIAAGGINLLDFTESLLVIGHHGTKDLHTLWQKFNKWAAANLIENKTPWNDIEV